MAKRALITGVTGQSGSYLAEYLISLGYDVHGVVRRLSGSNYERIQHLLDLGKVTLWNADMLDQSSLVSVLSDVRPDEVYNLAAQSFVPVSWNQPVLTAEVTGLGVLKVLEAIRQVDKNIRFYQASSSEMFGKVREEPQTELTPLHPRSPYGAAKAYGHYITVNYRESYGLYACSGIVYNHETIKPDCPICIRYNGIVRIVAADEIAPSGAVVRDVCGMWRTIVDDSSNYEIWDNGKWTKITAISRYVDYNKPTIRLLSRSGYVECTEGHVVCGADGDKPIEQFVPGDRVATVLLPEIGETCIKNGEALAWVLGFFVGDGSLHGSTRRATGKLQFFNKDIDKLRAVEANIRIFDSSALFRYEPHRSSFKPENINHKLSVKSELLRQICVGCYYECKPKALKRIPQCILNAPVSEIEAFLDGYADADGTKSLPGARYKFQYYTTKSEILAMGLRLLCHWTGRRVTYSCERRENEFSTGYYHRGFIRSKRADGLDGQLGMSGYNLMRDTQEVTKTWKDKSSEFVTITTESGTFSAGTGFLRLHNSPRRGLEFVTRKITDGVARIAYGLQDTLLLGNMDAERDWGFAGDYVRAMHLMLQQPSPDDYIVATGEKHTVREFCEIAFDRAGLRWQDHVEMDASLYRPAEVATLLGDASKIRALGWRPQVGFRRLVELMIDGDMGRYEARAIDVANRLGSAHYPPLRGNYDGP